MNPLILLLVNGHAFFLGMGMVLISLAAQRSLRHSLAQIGIRITGIVGVALVLASSPPFPFGCIASGLPSGWWHFYFPVVAHGG